MVLHGCNQNAEDFAKFFTPIASANNIVMVFPQAKACWDFRDGFTGGDFELNLSSHSTMMKRIIER